jgi:hypothetical protein
MREMGAESDAIKDVSIASIAGKFGEYLQARMKHLDCSLLCCLTSQMSFPVTTEAELHLVVRYGCHRFQGPRPVDLQLKAKGRFGSNFTETDKNPRASVRFSKFGHRR